MKFRFPECKISGEIFEKYEPILKTQIEETNNS